MDAVSSEPGKGDAVRVGVAYAPARLQVLGSLRDLTQVEVPESGGRGGGGELGPSFVPS
jgi:hypothetical protein